MPHDPPDIRAHLSSFARFQGGGCIAAMEGKVTQGEIASRIDGIFATLKTALDAGTCDLRTIQIAQKRLANIAYEIDRDAIVEEIVSE